MEWTKISEPERLERLRELVDELSKTNSRPKARLEAKERELKARMRQAGIRFSKDPIERLELVFAALLDFDGTETPGNERSE